MIQFTASQAAKYREYINKTAVTLTDDDAAYVPMMFERWAAGVAYNDRLYKVLQAHTSQAGWEPDAAVSLFAEILIPDPSVIPEWVQPSSTNPYMKGDKVRHNDKVWVSDVNNNVWEPGVYGWSEVA